jgi:hypothetical protein
MSQPQPQQQLVHVAAGEVLAPGIVANRDVDVLLETVYSHGSGPLHDNIYKTTFTRTEDGGLDGRPAHTLRAYRTVEDHDWRDGEFRVTVWRRPALGRLDFFCITPGSYVLK